ncbi:MAG TPA: TetR family transcriptional regulator [Acidimicrobiales bacterium]|nr:TetR family transcriptional regulator [Acidimicrobiales bacterium]
MVVGRVGAHRDAERTRDRILDAARAAFARHGYDGTTVRTVAADAGVAPNLITRYFGGKPGLFRAATAAELGVAAVLPGPVEGLGARLAANVVRRWEGVEPEDPLLMRLRSAGSSDTAARELGEFFQRQACNPLAAHLEGVLGCSRPDAEDRVAAVGALIMGLVTSRYLMRIGPLFAAEPPALEAWLAERIQRLLESPAPALARPQERSPSAP